MATITRIIEARFTDGTLRYLIEGPSGMSAGWYTDRAEAERDARLFGGDKVEFVPAPAAKLRVVAA